MHQCINIRRSGSDTELHHHLCNQVVNSTLSHNMLNRHYYSFKFQRKLEIVSALTPMSDTDIIVVVKPCHFSGNKRIHVVK